MDPEGVVGVGTDDEESRSHDDRGDRGRDPDKDGEGGVVWEIGEDSGDGHDLYETGRAFYRRRPRARGCTDRSECGEGEGEHERDDQPFHNGAMIAHSIYR